MNMRITPAIVAGGLMVCGAPALAQSTLFEIDMATSQDWRDGSAVSFSGFGGKPGAGRERQRTPALPDMLRAIGAVPIVD